MEDRWDSVGGILVSDGLLVDGILVLDGAETVLLLVVKLQTA